VRHARVGLAQQQGAVTGVTGIGEFFFRATDPAALSAWYDEHLGVGTGQFGNWQMHAGPSVFAAVPRDSEHFPVDHAWMLNLRVDDLDALVEALLIAGIAVTTDLAWSGPGVGRFARLHDPEGNPVGCGSQRTTRAPRHSPLDAVEASRRYPFDHRSTHHLAPSVSLPTSQDGLVFPGFALTEVTISD